jgi:hypothetical protein
MVYSIESHADLFDDGIGDAIHFAVKGRKCELSPVLGSMHFACWDGASMYLKHDNTPELFLIVGALLGPLFKELLLCLGIFFLIFVTPLSIRIRCNLR